MSQTRLFVGNLPNNFNENELRSAFSNYGEVINFDIKSKPTADNAASTFAFVTISSANNEVEACIRHFSNIEFNGSKLYVTRARESFLERLQRERQQNEDKEAEKKQHKELHASKKHPVIKLGDKLNPRKRKADIEQNGIPPIKNFKEQKMNSPKPPGDGVQTIDQNTSVADKKKLESNKKRMESMQKKRQEFKSKQQIIKTGLIGIDKKINKKLRFSDTEDDTFVQPVTQSNHSEPKQQGKKNTLFDDDESDGEVNFEIKKQYEGKKGQKVLDLQSKYKSDKRFVLDERFIEDDQTEDEDQEGQGDRDPSTHIDVTQGDEKSKQIKILEDVLGVTIKAHATKPDKDKKIKPNMGMIRFDPMNPEHAKFVVPPEEIKPEPKKSKKNKTKEQVEPAPSLPEPPKVEVSKDQFYKIEITKEAFEKPAEGFSLRSLFARDNDNDTSSQDQHEQNASNLPIQLKKQQKVKNPLDPGERNPFVYDSSESEAEDEGKCGEKNSKTDKTLPEITEVRAVWKENLFFSKNDVRLKEGLAFFCNANSNEVPKERRELKSVMKKRIQNTERKNQMFKKKIGGRKKSMKKSYKKKS